MNPPDGTLPIVTDHRFDDGVRWEYEACGTCGLPREQHLRDQEIEPVARALFDESGPHKWYPKGFPEGVEYTWDVMPEPWKSEGYEWLDEDDRKVWRDSAAAAIAALDEYRRTQVPA